MTPMIMAVSMKNTGPDSIASEYNAATIRIIAIADFVRSESFASDATEEFGPVLSM